MRATRGLALAMALLLGVSATASAQRITAPGSYDAKVVLLPDLLPAGELKDSLLAHGVDQGIVWEGKVEINQTGNGVYHVTFDGLTADGLGARARAQFSPEWTGFLLGSIPVGAELVTDAIVSIDVAHLIRGAGRGTATVNTGLPVTISGRFGDGGVVLQFNVR